LTNTSFLLAKFGQKEHLESLANGIVYLNPISKYRNDTTNYRGDNNEGAIPIDPSEIKIFDEAGKNLFDKIPRPTYAKQTRVGDDSMLMFCASMITMKVLHNLNESYVFTNDYKSSIREFGEYVLLFHSEELLALLRNSQKSANPPFGFDSGPIIYRDLNDFSKDGDYYSAYRATGSNLDPCFVKSDTYEMQNEWRLIVDGSYEPLPTNDDGSYTIKIDKMEWAFLYETETFLETFTWKND